MLLRSCLLPITIIVLRHILYLVHLCPCLVLVLVLFMSYLCDLVFIFSLIFIAINHIILLKQTKLFFAHFQNILFQFWMITKMKKRNNFKQQKSSLKVLLSFCLSFNQFQSGVAYKNVAYKKNQAQEQDLRNKIFPKYRICAGTQRIA